MSDHHSAGRGWRTTLAATAAIALLTGGIAAAPAGASTEPDAVPVTTAPTDPQTGSPTEPKAAGTPAEAKIGAEDLERLAEAEAAGDRTVTVMFASRDGDAKAAREALVALGATIRYAADKYNYFSARVPVGAVAKAAKEPTVKALDLDEVVPLPDVDLDEERGTGGIAPDASTPDSNAFMPTNETGAVRFKQRDPRWDGRGVTIGILDSGVDLGHPALAETSTGERKIVDTFTATDPLTEGSLVAGGDATWLPMIQNATGPTFPPVGTYRGSAWTLPSGTYKIRTFDEARTDGPGCEVCGDANRDGDKTDRIGVLYDPATNDVWVDSDDDKSFTDETMMRPYNEAFQVGELGRDNSGTGLRESMPFTVDFREDQDILGTFGPGTGLPDTVDFVDIGLASGAHGSHVAGITAANDMFGGQMDGAAPGATLVSARACTFGPGCTAAALTDGMAELAANRGVDIINMSIGGLPALNDGSGARNELYNEIIADGVQLVISAGNSGNALNTIGDPSVATDVVSVGASISRETWKANYGADVRFAKNMLTFSSGGPREDGGFKPNITAPGSAISTTPTWQPGGPVAEAGYGLPPGYSMFNGTSMASPQAAGAMALLLSAAKSRGVDTLNSGALRQAVYSSARYNSEVPAFLQGHGEIDVPAAWELYRRNLAPDIFTVSAPVCNEVWKILSRTEGTGVYNRCAVGDGGQAAGSQRSYPVTVTRKSGPARSGTYRVSLVGNDGTFSTQTRSVALPLNRPVTLQLTARPAAGAHSVLMRFDDDRTRGVDLSVMNVVVAGTSLGAPAYSWTQSGTAQRNEATRYYLTVPAGTKALELTMSGRAEGSQTRFLAFHPFGVGVDPGATTRCYSNYLDGNGCNPDTRSYEDPQPGVWEILVESRRTTPMQENPWKLDATLLGATVTPATVTLDSVVKGVPSPVSWVVRNDFATVTAAAEGGALGSAFSDRPSIANGALSTFTVEVPAGAASLDVSIGNTSDAGADLDLYVLDPAGEVVGQDADGDSEESVSIPEPAAGVYTVEIDGFDVPAGTTEYDYLDVFYSPALGALAVDDPAPFEFAAGSTRTISATVTALEAVPAGRSLLGEMRVVSGSGTVLGKGAVLIKAVTG